MPRGSEREGGRPGSWERVMGGLLFGEGEGVVETEEGRGRGTEKRGGS
ncbi:MAG: hypothetical protein ACOX05_01865 [Bacillota bacterium]